MIEEDENSTTKAISLLKRCGSVRIRLRKELFLNNYSLKSDQIYPRFNEVLEEFLSEILKIPQEVPSFDRLTQNLEELNQKTPPVGSNLVSHCQEGRIIYQDYEGILNEIMFLAPEVYSIASHTVTPTLLGDEVDRITVTKTKSDRLDTITSPLDIDVIDNTKGILRIIDQEITRIPRHDFPVKKRH